MERGARLSGSRFAYLRGDLVLLELALVRWALEKLRGEGFEPVIPPVLVREQALYGTGFLPDTEQQIYHLPDDDLYLVGTSRGRARLAARAARSSTARRCRCATPASRRASAARPAPPARTRAGSSACTSSTRSRCSASSSPSDSADEHERILAIEESILQDLEIPYRVVNIAVDDLGASAAKKYDCEAWLPGQGRYRELTSCSNTTDFQARRLDIRYRAEDAKSRETLHTLNGTAVAVGRTIIALLENGQQDDGSIAIPPALVAAGARRALARRRADGPARCSARARRRPRRRRPRYDLLQRRHAILRNFPIVGHLRYLLEAIGPELRQYIVTEQRRGAAVLARPAALGLRVGEAARTTTSASAPTTTSSGRRLHRRSSTRRSRCRRRTPASPAATRLPAARRARCSAARAGARTRSGRRRSSTSRR